MREARAHTLTCSPSKWVYQTICYFDIFNFPLRKDEIHGFCSTKLSVAELDDMLSELVAMGRISVWKDYYFLPGASEENIQRRQADEACLGREMGKIRKYAALVSRFPFVEGCFISGSVSKGVLSAAGDVDFFIVARSGRVWLCRTLLVAFKKIVLLNSRKYFCVNYFVDTANLKVPDDNLFVATEISTLLPVCHNPITRQFYEANQWALNHFPNRVQTNASLLSQANKPMLSRMIEAVLRGAVGEWLDNCFFRMTLRRWKKKFPYFDQMEFDLNMRSYKNVSKHHPQGHQQKVLQALELRMKNFH